jgi:hypothetical protein
MSEVEGRTLGAWQSRCRSGHRLAVGRVSAKLFVNRDPTSSSLWASRIVSHCSSEVENPVPNGTRTPRRTAPDDEAICPSIQQSFSAPPHSGGPPTVMNSRQFFLSNGFHTRVFGFETGHIWVWQFTLISRQLQELHCLVFFKMGSFLHFDTFRDSVDGRRPRLPLLE